jgi:hypothetical protein
MTRRRFVHTLTIPEHLWVDFFRTFFSQASLVVDEDGQSIENRFLYEIRPGKENRQFDVIFEHDMEGANPNILPSVVIEDLGVSTLGISLNKLADWSVVPETSKTRSDLLRSTYVFHCCSKDRGESRLLASIVSNSIIVFYDQLLREGLHKVEPWSIGKTVPIKSDSDEVYVDTPVNVTFEFQQTWRTVEDGETGAKSFCMIVRTDELQQYVRASMNISDAAILRYVAMSMNLRDPNATIYVNMTGEITDPLRTENYVLASTDVINPESEDRYVRASMRVA